MTFSPLLSSICTQSVLFLSTRDIPGKTRAWKMTQHVKLPCNLILTPETQVKQPGMVAHIFDFSIPIVLWEVKRGELARSL